MGFLFDTMILLFMLKYFLIPFLFILLTTRAVHGQADFPEELSQPQTDSLMKYEMMLKEIGDSMLGGQSEDVRANAVMKYIPLLVKTLKFRGSFDYPFDSLKFMKKLKPEDQSFRIYNWNLQFDDQTFRYYGAIQLDYKNRLMLFPLFDRSDNIPDSLAEDTILTHENWYGAQYYALIEEKHKRQKFYTLLGWDGSTHISNKKIIDVLTFNEQGLPVFGAPMFEWGEDTVKTRVIFEFSNQAVMALDYLPRHNIITYDHLSPPDEKSKGKKFTYVPDGSYDYFIYKRGKWIRKELLFETYKKKIEMEDFQYNTR
ncbi:MAG: hypothetical protein WD077_07550 [Bacteroidia bacterium]